MGGGRQVGRREAEHEMYAKETLHACYACLPQGSANLCEDEVGHHAAGLADVKLVRPVRKESIVDELVFL